MRLREAQLMRPLVALAGLTAVGVMVGLLLLQLLMQQLMQLGLLLMQQLMQLGLLLGQQLLQLLVGRAVVLLVVELLLAGLVGLVWLLLV